MRPFSLTPKTSPSEHLHYKPEHEGDHPLHTLRTLGYVNSPFLEGEIGVARQSSLMRILTKF